MKASKPQKHFALAWQSQRAPPSPPPLARGSIPNIITANKVSVAPPGEYV